MRPVLIWLAGIALLVLLLYRAGGLRGRAAPFVEGVFVIALLVSFFLFRRKT